MSAWNKGLRTATISGTPCKIRRYPNGLVELAIGAERFTLTDGERFELMDALSGNANPFESVTALGSVMEDRAHRYWN